MMKAIELYKLYKCKVIVFHSVEHHAIPSSDMVMAPSFAAPHIYSVSDPDIKRIREVYEQNAKAIIDRAEEIFLDAGIEVDARLEPEYDPVSYIRELVKQGEVDLIILGSKGKHTLIGEILLGSVTEKVLRHVDCDIFIVR